MKDLFPDIDFSQENVIEGIIKGLSKYITDKYEVDPNRISIKDFMELLVKKMDIPIYDRKGNQLWPEKLNHEEIEKIVKTGV